LLSREFGIHPYPAEKLWKQAVVTKARSVLTILRSLLETDLMMKTGRGDATLLLESVLAETVNGPDGRLN
jgi:DNA polymerase III delta subunit